MIVTLLVSETVSFAGSCDERLFAALMASKDSIQAKVAEIGKRKWSELPVFSEPALTWKKFHPPGEPGNFNHGFWTATTTDGNVLLLKALSTGKFKSEDYLNSTAANAKALSDFGIGPHFHGTILSPNGDRAIVMDFIEGDHFRPEKFVEKFKGPYRSTMLTDMENLDKFLKKMVLFYMIFSSCWERTVELLSWTPT